MHFNIPIFFLLSRTQFQNINISFSKSVTSLTTLNLIQSEILISLMEKANESYFSSVSIWTQFSSAPVIDFISSNAPCLVISPGCTFPMECPENKLNYADTSCHVLLIQSLLRFLSLTGNIAENRVKQQKRILPN